MLLNSSVNPAFERIPMVALESRQDRRLPARTTYPGRPKGRIYSNIPNCGLDIEDCQSKNNPKRVEKPGRMVLILTLNMLL